MFISFFQLIRKPKTVIPTALLLPSLDMTAQSGRFITNCVDPQSTLMSASTLYPKAIPEQS